MKTNMTDRNLRTLGSAALAALTVFLAGCAGLGASDEKSENQAPDAKLTSEQNKGWAGEDFVFDARESSDPDGNISSWRFDFGDGSTPVEVTTKDQARMSHNYLRGGEYAVTVTVFDSGEKQQGALSDTATTTVAVNERFEVPVGPVYAYSPPSGGNNTTGKTSFAFDATEDADRYDLDLTLRNGLPAGDSRIVVRVIDPDGDVDDEATVTLSGANAMKSVHLEGIMGPNPEGQWKIEIEAQTGGTTGDGDVEVYYDRGYESDE